MENTEKNFDSQIDVKRISDTRNIENFVNSGNNSRQKPASRTDLEFPVGYPFAENQFVGRLKRLENLVRVYLRNTRCRCIDPDKKR